MKIQLSKHTRYEIEPYWSMIIQLHEDPDWFDPIETFNAIWEEDHHLIVQELMVLGEEAPEMDEAILEEVFRIIKITQNPETIELIMAWYPEMQTDESMRALLYYCRNDRFIISAFCDFHILHTDIWCFYFLTEELNNRELVKLISNISNDWAKPEFVNKLRNNGPSPAHIYQLLKNDDNIDPDEWLPILKKLNPKPGLIALFILNVPGINRNLWSRYFYKIGGNDGMTRELEERKGLLQKSKMIDEGPLGDPF